MGLVVYFGELSDIGCFEVHQGDSRRNGEQELVIEAINCPNSF